MADASRIKIGDIYYDVKDEEARKAIEQADSCVLLGDCTSDSDAGTKVVSVENDTGSEMYGMIVSIYFANGSTVDSPSLNVGVRRSIPIGLNGAEASENNPFLWVKELYIAFVLGSVQNKLAWIPIGAKTAYSVVCGSENSQRSKYIDLGNGAVLQKGTVIDVEFDEGNEREEILLDIDAVRKFDVKGYVLCERDEHITFIFDGQMFYTTTNNELERLAQSGSTPTYDGDTETLIF